MQYPFTKKKSSQPNLRFLALVLSIFISLNCMGQDKIIRKELMKADIGNRMVKKVDAREINFKPGQKTGYHFHPCPVIGYIVSGSVLFQVKGDSLRTLKAGDTFFEPAATPITRFDNASKTENLKFIGYYLLNEETELIHLLPSPPEN